MFRVYQATALIAIGWITFSCIFYVLSPNYFDHCEPTIASLSWIALNGGQDLYPSAEAASRYSFHYGPLTYLVHSLIFITAGPSIIASKSMGAIACLISLCLIFFSTRSTLSSNLALLITGISATLILGFYNYGYWNRPDPFLLLLTSISVFFLSTKSSKASLYAGVACIALAVNFKLHGFVYFLPLFAHVIKKISVKEVNIRILFLTFAALLCFPFLLPSISTLNYFNLLSMASKHGFDSGIFLDNLQFIFITFLPISWLIWLNRKKFNAGDRQFFLFGFASIALVLVPASKAGAGPHHFIPFLPIMAFSYAILLKSTLTTSAETKVPNFNKIFLLFFYISFGSAIFLGFSSQRHIMYFFRNTDKHMAEVEEVQKILENHKGQYIQMGYSDGDHYSSSFPRSLLTFAGNRLFIDAAPMMDFEKSNIPISAASIQAIDSCSVDIWIIPKGDAFSLISGYSPSRRLFEDRFTDAFFANYEISESLLHYDIWTCR